MQSVTLPRIGTATAWREAARAALAQGIRPDALVWQMEGDEQGLFEAPPLPLDGAGRPVKVSRAFVELADIVVWHRDPQCFARLYHVLWRLRREPGLLSDRGDAEVARLRTMDKNVRRCMHKMKAFVRFRDLRPESGARRSFAAWFEPTHRTLEPTSGFFVRRFADMDWMIATPDATAVFRDGTLRFEPGAPRPDLPEDAAEELWGTYFRNIFNPARVKVKAMTSEMPRKYWKNMPETRHIPDLLAGAEARVREMAEAAPTLAPARSGRIRARWNAPRQEARLTFADLRERAAEENAAPLPGYGRLILGEGPQEAALMIVGEQPGATEDEEGRPFVGPAGQMLDACAAEAGLDRGAAYVTNAVKRFRFRQQGTRRLHQPPSAGDIEHARWWLIREIEIVRPRLILAMGATAAQTLTGRREDLLRRRGAVEDTPLGPVFLTLHPAYILRLPKGESIAARETLTADLAAVQQRLA